MKPFLLLATLALTPGVAQAVIGVTNLGTTTPTGFATGNTAFDPHSSIEGLPEVFGFRLNNTHGQTFSLGGYGIELEKIHVGYGTLTGAATATTITLTVDAGNDGSNEITESFTLTAASLTQEAAAPYGGVHWLELDVSSSALVLPPGTHSFKLTATSITGASNTYLLAPSYTFGNLYTGGHMTGNGAGGDAARDANFAISGPPPDVDNDGLPDPWELSFAGITSLTDLNGTLPAGSGPGAGTGDFDGDGLSDLGELTNTANPTLTDTDTDGLNDNSEVGGLQNPYTGSTLGSVPGSPTLPNDSDCDDDGIPDGQEVVAGTDGFITNPNLADTDADGMPDLYEGTNNLLGGLNPTRPSDGAAGQDLDGDGIDNIDEYNRTPQTRADKADTDADGYSDNIEDNSGAWASISATGTNPVNPDTDGDGLLDGTENPDLVTDNPPSQNKCNPNLFDTDNDFYSDGVEVGSGSLPGTAASVPIGVPIRGTCFVDTSGWTSAGTTLKTTTELLTGSGQYANIDMAAQDNGVVLPYPNPSATAYCSLDFRIDGTFGGGTALANFNSGGRNAPTSDATVHCIVRLYETDGSIQAFDGTNFLSVVPAGGIVSGTTYTVQIDHDIPGQTYGARVYNRNTGTLIGSISGVPTRATSNPLANPLYFTAGTQTASANWDLAVDNMLVSLSPLTVPGAVTAELRITGTSINGSGEFLIDFVGAPTTSYEVTKSLTLQAASFVPLSAPLIVTTGANGTGQAVVPAAEKTEPSAFFRVETP